MKYAIFNTLEAAEAMQSQIDNVLGYDGSWTTEHMFGIMKHPSQDLWAICLGDAHGMNNADIQFKKTVVPLDSGVGLRVLYDLIDEDKTIITHAQMENDGWFLNELS